MTANKMSIVNNIKMPVPLFHTDNFSTAAGVASCAIALLAILKESKSAKIDLLYFKFVFIVFLI